MKDTKDNAKQSMIKMYNVTDFYQIIDKVGRGTYGTVYKAKGLKDGRFYAIKKLQNNDSKLQQQGFPITALREITLLKQIDHPNIIKLKEIIVSRPNKRNLYRGSTFLVFEYMDHDFAGLFKMKSKFSLPQIKCIIRQLLEGVCYLHRNKILHRDIKSANILLNDEGDVKLADFGLGRKIRFQNMFTYKVVTLWYRAPQLLLGSKTYTDKIDVWSVGCVVAEFFTGEVLFKKQTEFAQMERIYEIVGDFQANDIKINEQSYKIYQNLQDLRPRKSYSKEIANYFKKNCPGISEVSLDFIDRLLRLDPNKRMSCQQALRHPFFSEKPLACNKTQIQKMQYECHEMFKDRSIKIQRSLKVDDEHQARIKFKENRENRQPRDVVREVKQHKQRGRELEERKYIKTYRNDKEKQFRDRDNKGRQGRFFYEGRKNEKYRSSEDKSSYDRNSDSYSSSSKSSQYSSSSRSRSRHNERRIKDEDRRSRDQYKSRQHYVRRDQKRRPERKDERRSADKFQRERKDDFQRKDKYYKNERDQRYPGHKDYRRKDQRVHSKRQYREQRVVFKKDEKPEERRDDYKEDKRPFEREPRDKREQWKKESKQRKYQKYQKAGYQSKGRYNDERDYKRRQQKWVQKNVKEEDKYQDTQKYDFHRKNDGSQKRDNKYYFVSGKEPYRKKDYRNSSSSQRSSNHRYKKEKDYRKPYNYQRKNHYKKSHQDSNDHRNH